MSKRKRKLDIESKLKEWRGGGIGKSITAWIIIIILIIFFVFTFDY